jgi:hypothetical protein
MPVGRARSRKIDRTGGIRRERRAAALEGIKGCSERRCRPAVSSLVLGARMARIGRPDCIRRASRSTYTGCVTLSMMVFKNEQSDRGSSLREERLKFKPIESLCAVDHSARGSMKNAAKCET